jgi:DNA-binding LytR/AlgR family response regulator
MRSGAEARGRGCGRAALALVLACLAAFVVAAQPQTARAESRLSAAETLVAMMLEMMLKAFGCVVVGVAGTLARAMALAGNEATAIDGAILDVNLGGENVYPVAERLAERGAPFVFCTGYGLTGLLANFAHVPTLAKPYQSSELEQLLVSTLVGQV